MQQIGLEQFFAYNNLPTMTYQNPFPKQNNDYRRKLEKLSIILHDSNQVQPVSQSNQQNSARSLHLRSTEQNNARLVYLKSCGIYNQDMFFFMKGSEYKKQCSYTIISPIHEAYFVLCCNRQVVKIIYQHQNTDQIQIHFIGGVVGIVYPCLEKKL